MGYVRRVLVSEKFEDLLPKYLNFVRGVVDSDDLPLNVSREQLQQNKIMKVISKKLVRKVLELMKKLAKEDDSGDEDDEEKDDDEEKEEKKDDEKKDEEEKKDKKDEESTWAKFYKEFNKNLKMGCYEDDSNRSKISKLLRFTTTKSEEKDISLDKYLDRMQESQESIYYMSGDNLEVMKKSPSLQVFKKKDIEVLMLSDHLDEPCIQKLTDSPVVVVTSQFGYSAQQEKIMKAQAFQNKDQMGQMAGRKTLEVNANHPVIVDLLSKVKANKEDTAVLDTAQVLFQTALIESGYEIADPSALVNRVYRLMSKELGVDPDAPLTEVEVPEGEEEEEAEEEEDKDDADEESDDDKEEAKEEL